MLIQQQAKLPCLSAALPGEACLEKPFFLYIKGVPETSALTGPDPAQLHTYSKGVCTSSENSH